MQANDKSCINVIIAVSATSTNVVVVFSFLTLCVQVISKLKWYIIHKATKL